jgi:hypothetical protein
VAIAAVIAGCVSLGMAATMYPGGTYFDRSALGFDPLRNYWSDLMRPVALGGEPNPVGARLATGATLAFAAGLLVFWWAAAEAFRDQVRLRNGLRILAALSAVSLIGVPPGLLGVRHGVAIFASVALGAAAATTTLVGQSRAPDVPRWIVALGGAAVVLSVVGFGSFVRDAAAGGTRSIATPALQKMATLFLVAWVLGGAGHQLRRGSGTGSRVATK